ncbi:MAG: DoxX family protein [Acidobacteriota bacterium]|nr:DoxX family protein [Acidobacteriota bacterium]
MLQLVVALGLLNVWLLRRGRATSYRGGGSKTLKEEFAAYGLPDGAFYVVGALKVLSAAALIAGIWFPALVLPAAAVVAVLMVGALVMHVKVKDPAIKSLPAFLMLLMSGDLCALALL